MAAVLGGTQSLHTNGFDEALALPSQKAATIALRTQQVLGYETGIAGAADPLGGSYFVESLTDEIEERAREYLEKIDAMGGAVEAIESGWMKREIEDAAYKIMQGIEDGSRVVVGVNKFESEEEQVELYSLDPELERRQVDRLAKIRAERDQGAVDKSLKALEDAAKGTDNLLYPMREALSSYATLGEVSNVLRGVFGEYEPSVF
jgi:methylmalonyl-CoA mutase N-terminal domain/subunit